MPTTLTMQVVLNPSDPLRVFGRFANDNAQGSLSQRSKVWITDTGNGSPTVSTSNTATVQVQSADPTTPLVQVQIVPNLGSWSWQNGPGGYALQLAAVFGRAAHGNARDQIYASPFALAGSPGVPCTVFTVTFTAGQLAAGSPAVLPLGVAVFRSPAPPLLTSISPNQFTSQSGPALFTLTGEDFVSGASLVFTAGASASGLSITATQITGTMAVPDVSVPTPASVAVAQNSQTSPSIGFTINPSPDYAAGNGGPGRGAAGDRGGPGGGKRTLGNDLYQFNVAALAYVNNGGTLQTLAFGHDPDMEVGG